MAVVETHLENTILVVTMTGGENRNNPDFVRDMLAALGRVQEDPSITAAAIFSESDKHWSLGVDTDWMGKRFVEGDTEAIKQMLYGMNEVFKALLLLPVPAIAGIGGHAFGNGAILSCACDFRFMKKDRGWFCFPEVDIGIPFMPGMIEFVKKALPYYLFNELKLSGRRATAVELERHHVIQKACEDEEDLRKSVLEFAGLFRKKRGIFGEHKKRMHRNILSVMENEDPGIIDPLHVMVAD